MKINQILLWAGPDQVPLSFYWNLNENHSDSADTFVYVWFDCLVCVRFSSANMNRYDCLGLVWLIGLLRFFQWNRSSTIKRRFPFKCQTRLLQNYTYIYIYIYICIQKLKVSRSLIWGGFGEVLERILERFRRPNSSKHMLLYNVFCLQPLKSQWCSFFFHVVV